MNEIYGQDFIVVEIMRMSRKRKYWHQMSFIEWMWQENKFAFVFLMGLGILGILMIILGLFV